MRFLPLGIDVHDRACLVAGGGPVGTRKALTLARAGANVTVVSPTVSADLAREVEAGRLGWIEARFGAEHLTGAWLVVMATDDVDLNAAGARLARLRHLLVCDASSAEHSQVVFPALWEGDGLIVGVFSDGRDPARSRAARDRIESVLADRTATSGDERAPDRDGDPI